MGVKEKATALHESGFNCAQSVLCALGAYTGLDEETALALSGGFGGGVNCGEICGAASGAVMALGLASPHTEGADFEAKQRIRRLAASYNRAFRERYGCIRCVELKREGHPCAELIEYAAESAEEMLKELKG